MKKVGVIYGGVSCEHDVSVITALQLMENMDRSKYEIYPIYIHSDGEWYVDEKLLNPKIYAEFEQYKEGIMKGHIAPNKPGILIGVKSLFFKENYIPLDVVIPALHGMNGEDGSVQGLLELANIPYTSSGILGSSVGMDKIIMKKVFEAYGFPVLPYTCFLRSEWEKDKEAIVARIESTLPYPMFVKPANLGSSIGIAKVKNNDELRVAIEVALSFDERAIVEKALENIKEVNCSAIGRADSVKVSTTEEPVGWHEFLTFDEKYLGGNKGKIEGVKNTMENMSRKVPAEISESQTNEVQRLTKEVFKALNSKGVVRVDFLIDNSDGKVYVNEINTIPGSLAFYLWKHDGVSYEKLIEQIIEIAEQENKEKNRNNYTYESNIVGNIGEGSKT